MTLLVESVMWRIVLICIFSASSKFAVTEELRHEQDVFGQLKYSPSFRAPLPYAPPSSLYPPGDTEDNIVEVPLVYTKNVLQSEDPQTYPNNCPQLETLESILVLLKRLLNEKDNSYVLPPDNRIQILKSLKEYLEGSGSNINGLDNNQKLMELIRRTDRSLFLKNNALRKGIYDKNPKQRIEANLILKYDIPSISKVGCKEALATLIETVKRAYSQMIEYCNLTGKCALNSDPSLQIDNYNTLPNILTLDQPVPTQSQILPSNQHLLNIYDTQSSINNLVKLQNQVLNHEVSNQYLNPSTQLLLDNNNQFVTTSDLNSGFDQTLNNKKNNIDAYNIYLNKDESQSNIQHSKRANILNSILSFQPSNPAQIQITPAYRYPLYKPIPNVQAPINNLFPPNQDDISQKGNYDYLNLHAYREPQLDSNQFLTTSALNSGVVQIKNLNNQEENVDTSKYRYFNIFDSNNERNLNALTTGINKFDGISKPLSLIQSQNINNNNEPNQRLSYQLSQMFNDKTASLAFTNQNKHNINERLQYEGASIPRYEYNNLNYLPYVKPYEINNLASESLISSNKEINFNRLKNQDATKLVYPTFYSDFNKNQNPYINSLNFNRENSMNYKSQQADTAIQSNFGLNLYTPTNFPNYPKLDIYGNTPLDFHRWASVPNLFKLNSVADNDGIVELTYELKRPQPINYNPYYYVKFRMPYRDFVSKIVDLSKNPHLRSDPMKFHEALLSISNLAEAPPDLKNIDRDEVSKFILSNGGILTNAKVLGTEDSDAEQYLKTVQNLNANLNTNEILNLDENVKKYNPYTPFDSNIPYFRQEKSHEGELLNQNLNAQYIIDTEPRRLFVPVAQYYPKAPSISFLPAKVASQVISNPENLHIKYTTWK